MYVHYEYSIYTKYDQFRHPELRNCFDHYYTIWVLHFLLYNYVDKWCSNKQKDGFLFIPFLNIPV